MKKSIGILLVALMATGMSLTAQHRRNGAPQGDGARMGKPGMGVFKELNLTDDQKAKMKKLHEGFVAQDSVVKDQLKKQRQAVQSERKLALNKILTPEQLLLLDKMRVEKEKAVGKKGQFGPGKGQQGFRQGGFAGRGRGQMMGQGHGPLMGMGNGCPNCNGKAIQKHAKRGNAGPRMNPEIRIKNQVEHMTKLLDLTSEQAAQIQAIRQKHTKKEIAAFQKREKKHKAQLKIRTEKFDEIKAVLTPEQVKKIDALKEKVPKKQRMEGSRNRPMQGRKVSS